MIRRTFLKTIALFAGGLTGWLKGPPSVSALPKCGGFDITCPTGWTVTHWIDKDGLHVIHAFARDPKGYFPREPHGFRRDVSVKEDVFAKHWNVCITDREIPRGL